MGRLNSKSHPLLSLNSVFCLPLSGQSREARFKHETPLSQLNGRLIDTAISGLDGQQLSARVLGARLN